MQTKGINGVLTMDLNKNAIEFVYDK